MERYRILWMRIVFLLSSSFTCGKQASKHGRQDDGWSMRSKETEEKATFAWRKHGTQTCLNLNIIITKHMNISTSRDSIFHNRPRAITGETSHSKNQQWRQHPSSTPPLWLPSSLLSSPHLQYRAPSQPSTLQHHGAPIVPSQHPFWRTCTPKRHPIGMSCTWHLTITTHKCRPLLGEVAVLFHKFRSIMLRNDRISNVTLVPVPGRKYPCWAWHRQIENSVSRPWLSWKQRLGKLLRRMVSMILWH